MSIITALPLMLQLLVYMRFYTTGWLHRVDETYLANASHQFATGSNTSNSLQPFFLKEEKFELLCRAIVKLAGSINIVATATL